MDRPTSGINIFGNKTDRFNKFFVWLDGLDDHPLSFTNIAGVLIKCLITKHNQKPRELVSGEPFDIHQISLIYESQQQ